MLACLAPLLCATVVAISPEPLSANPVETVAAVEAAAAADDVIAAQSPAETVFPVDQSPRRPVCASLFLTGDWQLTSKQKACDWLHNRLFSVSVAASATWSALAAPKLASLLGHDELPDTFSKRFGMNVTQNVFKSTGAYLGGLIWHEDPRDSPPFLVLQPRHANGTVWHRLGDAFLSNFISYRCDDPCATAHDIKRVPAFSRITGAVASGLPVEIWPSTSDRTEAHRRALRGMASAYVASFVNSLAVQFKPELNALADHTITFLFGLR